MSHAVSSPALQPHISPHQTIETSTTFTAISTRRKVTNEIARVLVFATVIVAFIPLLWVLWELVSRGATVTLSSTWWMKSQMGIIESQAGGGAYHAIMGTLIQALITSALSIPIGVLTGIYLVEYAGQSRLGKVTTFMVDILTGVPSIVAALFIYSLWVVLFGFERSGMAVSLALVLLIVPVIIRNTEEMLRVVPQDLREAAYALGVPKWKTIARIVLPTAMSGIITGIMLSVARVMGESAPVLILVGYNVGTNFNPVEGPQTSLPLMMLAMYKAGTTGAAVDKMWGAAFTLVVIIAVLTIAARLISRRFSVKS